MLYLLFGPQGMMLEKQCKKIIKENLTEVDDFHCLRFMGDETPIQDIVSFADQTSLTGERKAVIVYRPYFLKATRSKEKIESLQNYNVLLDYLKNPSSDTDLIFVCECDKLNEKSEIVKLLKEKAKVIEAKEISKEDWPRFISQYFAKLGVKITQDAANELALRVENDALRFTNEAQKLALYSSFLTIEDIETMVAKPLEENAFLIYDCLLKNNKKKALTIYRDLLVEGTEPVQLISMLANQFRLLSEVAYLLKTMPSQQAIAKELGVHEYRVKIAKDYLRKYRLHDIHEKLNDLYELDASIKSGNVDRFFAFEMFLLNF